MIKILVISLPMLVCIFWSILLILDWWEQRTQAKARLLFFMVVSTALYGGHFIFFNHQYELMPITDTIYCMANLAVFPLYYIYIKEVTEEEWQKHWQITLMIPALLVGVIVGTLYLLMDHQETQAFVKTFLYQNSTKGLCDLAMIQAIVHTCSKIIFAIQIPLILVKGFRKIKRYDKMVEANYADTTLRKMYMVKTILVLFVVASFISFAANILGRDFFDTAPWLVLIPAVTFSTILFLLGYAGHRQNFTIQNMMLETANNPVPRLCISDSQLDGGKEDRIEKLKNEIAESVEKEQLFLQQDLKINDIAKLLHTNRDYIYQAINIRMGMSFSEYINRLRIDFAVQLMNESPKMTSNEIAFRSGFSSPASFYRNFKLYKDCPPLTYKKSMHPKMEQQNRNLSNSK